ncbi:MAG: glycosyltransferase family 2 protein [Patescibacteria group bacterium]
MQLLDFSVIIVSWNVKNSLRECLLSLRQYVNDQVKVIVVDNASVDGSRDLVNEFPEVRWQLQSENLGFGKACNLGARKACGEVLVFLNPDTKIGSDFISNITNFLVKHERAGVVGGKILNHNGAIQPSVRNLPSVWSGILDSLKLLGRFPKFGKKYLRLDFDYTKEQQVEQVMGACFIVRRELFNQLDGFDERFFLWFEEVDFCGRARQAGQEVWYAPTIQISHSKGQSFKQYSYLRRHFNFSKSLVQYIKKHKGVAAALVVLITSVPWFILAPVADLFKNIKYYVKK